MQNRGDDPFVAQIQVNGQHWCGEFIYNSEWIVTTAACVMGRYKSYTFTLNKFRFCFLNFWANHRYRHQSTALLVVVGQMISMLQIRRNKAFRFLPYIFTMIMTNILVIMTLPCYRYVPRRRLNFKSIKNNSVYQYKHSKFFKLSKDAILGNYVNERCYLLKS